ncbi:VCBS repeat-containing protein, partial [bacterium]|nr:VCBS repeat-containing protein [bacterium]
MKRIIGLLWLLPLISLAQDFVFTQEYDSIQVIIGEYEVPVPWVGGYSEAAPEFTDIDGDGDYDLFLGDTGGDLDFYLNVGGISNSEFILQEVNYQGITVSGSTFGGRSDPAFVDIDADQDLDCFTSDLRGLVHYWENVGSPEVPVFTWITDSLEDIDVIGRARIAFVDIDNDSDFDLFLGDNIGHIVYFENIGTVYVFDYLEITDFFESMEVGNSASPCFVDIDSDNDYDLFIGNKYGKIYYYRNDGSPLQYDFTLISNNWLGIDVGDYASPEFCDIDGDGDYDLFIGKDNDLTFDIPGAVHFWENTGTPQIPDFIEITQSYLTFDAGVVCEPDLCDIDQDGDMDLFFMTNLHLGWMENIGSLAAPSYVLQSYELLSLSPGSCDLADLNDDGIPDLVTVDGWGGNINLWLTTSAPPGLSFQFFRTLETNYLLYEVTLGDLDADGDQDMVVGGSEGMVPHLYHYENQGNPSQPNFVLVSQSLPGVNYDNVLQSCLLDLDLDEDLDLLVHSNWSTHTSYYENIGTPQQMNFQLITEDLLDDSLLLAVVDGADLDDDGDVDIISGHFDGGMKFFRNTTGDTAAVEPRLTLDPAHG